jgi:hypothetical protein
MLSEAAIRTLSKRRPDIHARVLAGEITPHGGMVEAGFRRRKPRKQSPLDKLERRLHRATAEGERAIADGNKVGGTNLRSDATKVNDRGSGYLLRRLARSAPGILAAYERGEFETPTAASPDR